MGGHWAGTGWGRERGHREAQGVFMSVCVCVCVCVCVLAVRRGAF